MITETDRLRIRKLTSDDSAFLLELMTEPSVTKYLGDRGIRTVADAKQFILQGPWTEHHDQGYGQFALELKPDGVLVGVCGILYRTKLDLCDVGFGLLPRYWRQGFAFEAVSALMGYGHDVLGVRVIKGLTAESNTASINLLKKLGMQFEKMVSMSNDGVANTRVYSESSATSQESSSD